MFGTLFLKECKLNLKSITYYVLCICIIGFMFSQIGNVDMRKPEKTDKHFGYTFTTDKSAVMKDTTKELNFEYKQNRYATYPLGFIKPVKLNEENQNKVNEIMTEVSSQTDNPDYYDEFLNKMDIIDKMVGGSSHYSLESIKNTNVPATYEQALESYNKIVNEDHVSSAYARMFSDYAGIIMGIMPVFLGVSVCLRDKKSKSEQVIYSSKISATQVVGARYLASVVMIMIPIVILAFLEDSQCIYAAKSLGIAPYYFEFLKCILGWILPTAMFSTAVGFFLTELLKGVWGIFIMVIWWFTSILSNSHNLTGGVGFNLVPRFNSLGNRDIYLSKVNELIINRTLYFALAIVLVIATICIFNFRRSGRLQFYGKLLPSIKS